MSCGKIPVQFHGVTYHFPGDISFDDIQMTFWNDDQMAIRKIFVRWMNEFVSNNMDGRSAIPNTNMNNIIEIQQFDNQFKPVYCAQLYHVWPTNIAEVNLSQDDADTRSESVISFSYSNIVTLDN
jgi:hypothetical protein